MGRHTRMRYVKYPPQNFYFESSESTLSSNSSVILTIAEFESMRLKHYISLSQTDSADKMQVSQPTFSRILETAHQKVTKALFEGKQIKIHGGNIDIKQGFIGYGCLNCNEEWNDPNASIERKAYCQRCNSDKTYYIEREIL